MEFDEPYTGKLFIYDTLAFFHSGGFPGYFFAVYSLNDYAHIQNFCMKGRGPNEFFEYAIVNPVEPLYLEGDELKMTIYDGNRHLVTCNISKVVRGDTEYVERIIPYEIGDFEASLSPMYRLDKKNLLIRVWYPTVSLHKSDEEGSIEVYRPPIFQIPPAYLVKKFEGGENEDNNMFGFFKQAIKNESQFDVFLTLDKIKPSGNELASAMSFLAQINILNIHTQQKKGIRIKGTLGFDHLSTIAADPTQMHCYYYSITVSNHFIYALYMNKSRSEFMNTGTSSNTIHVFDWEGNFVKILQLDSPVDQIVLDAATYNILYAKNDAEEKVFCYGKVE